MHSRPRRPLWVRVGNTTLALILFLSNTLYPGITALPLPPPAAAQEALVTATASADATPAASVATPAPSPLDPLENLDSLLLVSSPSAEIDIPEPSPETSPSAIPVPIPEPSPEDQISPPTLSPSPSPSLFPTPSPSVTSDKVSPPLPPLLSPFTLSLNYPFSGTYPISYGFGETSDSAYVRIMQNLFAVEAHDGIDFAMPEGTKILATAPGQVIFAGNGLYGTTLILQHSWGRSYYGHLSQVLVTMGQTVESLEVIALSGNTGVTTAPHLHYGIRPNHYDPYNGYRGMIDPLPYLLGQTLGAMNLNQKLIHLPHTTLRSTDFSLSIPILATSSASLTYTLIDPHGNSKIVYPSIYNFGTGQTAVLPRPSPFVPGQYHLEVKDSLTNDFDSLSFSWGVLTLNPNQSDYLLTQSATLSIAVLDELGEMVCDADLVLTLTSPDHSVTTLTTDNSGITRNRDVCQSKELTLTPDYFAEFTPSVTGVYLLSLTAFTPKHTYTITDSIVVHASLPYTLERYATTRIYPGNIYPVALKMTAHQDIVTPLSEIVPADFVTTPLTLADLTPWLSNDDLNLVDPAPYTRTSSTESSTLTWDLTLAAGQSKILGYTYDAPDQSPYIYSLGPATTKLGAESRAFQIAVDATDPVVGAFKSTAASWTSAGDANLDLAQPDPMSGDLMVAVIAIRPSASTVNTPSGWTSQGSFSGTDGGAEGVDTGSVSLYWFTKVASGSEGTANQTFTETGTTSVWIGNIYKVRSSTGTYDIALGGYSLNGDVTNWGGTLNTDIGLRTGDISFLAAAQNGDLSNSSAYAISSTNLNSQSTLTGRELGSTAGDDIEVLIAQNQVWDGNNTTTPTVALTQNNAASGAVTVLRIRQGSGTNRTDTWVTSQGVRASGTTSVVPTYPDHNYGDLLVMFVVSRGSGDPTPTTPTGWSLIGSSYNGGSGAFGVDAGNSRTTAYSRTATSRLTGSVTVTITGGSVGIGQIYAVHRDNSADSWSINSDGGTDTTVDTSWSVGGSGLSLNSSNGGSVILVANSINSDTYTFSSPSLTASGSTISTPTLDGSYLNSTNGNDMGYWGYHAEVTSGSSSGAPTFSSTASGSGGSTPAGSAMFVAITGTVETANTKAVGFFSPPSSWVSAGDANLSLTYPDPRNGDLLLAVIAIRPSSSTVNTPSGWSLIDNRTGTDSGAEGADTGSVGIYVFSKTSDGTEGTGSLAFTESGTTSVWIGNIMKLRSGTGTYSVSGSGYSINGDNTNWGGTLASDIGLTSGDLVVLAGAQNGNLSNTSAWNITATGVTTQSSVNEHGEYGSTTGDDIEVGLATTMIWEGTNSATPTVALTQSAAASGVVSAIRIRESTGTARTDTWVRSAGAQVAGTTTIALTYPEHEVGDLLVIFVSSRASTAPTPNAPYGWTSLGSYSGGAGSFGVDAGEARITGYYRVANSRYYGTLTLTVTSGDITIGQMLAIHNKDSTAWTLDSDGASDTSAGTSWSTTGSGLDLSSELGGDIVLVGSAVNTDAYTYSSHALSASGITFGEVTQTSTFNSSTGNDANLNVAMGRVTGGTSAGVAPTFTMTSSSSGASAPTGSSLFVRIVAVSPDNSITVSGTSNASNGTTVRLAKNSTLLLNTTTVNSGSWSFTGIGTPEADDIITVWLDSVADSAEATGITKYSSSNITDLVLDTNTLTLGSNQNTSLSLTNLNSYDCTEDEDIMHQAASSHLKVEGDSCDGSTTNSYSSEELTVSSSDTLNVGASDTLTTHNITIAGSVTSTSTATYNVSGNWDNTGTFTAANSTVYLNGIDSSTQVLSGTTTFYNLSASTTSNSAGRTINFTGGTTTTVSNEWDISGSTGKILSLGSTDTSSWTINPTSATIDYTTVSRSSSNLAICATHSTDGGNNNGNWSFSSGSSCSSNTAPNSPTSLAQKTTGDVTLSTGAWHNSTSVKFSATATDTDNPDTLYLCIEADQLGTSFSNTEDSCGSGVSYVGSGITVTHTITVTDAQEYHWQARVKDAGGLYSAWVSYDVNAESARDVGVDTTAPTGGVVYDGTSTGVDLTYATTSLSSLSANWDSFNSNVSGLSRYDYSIGTSAGATDIKTWTTNGTTTSVTATGLTLQTSTPYYFNVRAVDNAGNVQTAVSSNGQLISPSLSFALDSYTLNFDNLNSGNSYDDTATTTLTTSTNAYGGYLIRAYITDLLKDPTAIHSIPHFNGGTYASPATWGSSTGFGYTSSDTNVQGSDKFGGGTLYAPFSTTGPGDIVADHTAAVSGTSITNEQFSITYRVKASDTQPASRYSTTVVYTVTAQY